MIADLPGDGSLVRRVTVLRTQERIKALAAASGEAPVKIVQQVTASVPASSRQHLPSEKHCELIVEGEFCTTLDGREFLRCDCTSPDGARLLIFFRDENIRKLNDAPIWLMDGTFKTVSPLFEQLYTIHEASDLLRWWEDNYLLGKSRRRVAGGNSTVIIRSSPIFPPSLWNVLALTQDGFPRGNNAVEAWHRRWEILVGAQHLRVSRLITTMKREQARVEDDIEGAIRGQRRRLQNKKQKLRESRLAAALANRDNVDVLHVVPRASGGTVPMRIVKQASGFDGAFAVHGQQHRQRADRATPRPFAGPEHLRPLLGRCFSRTAAGYRYTLCPFDNVTQAEESARWNAYSGVLGVWQGWSAANGSLSGMHYGNGDSCGTLNRSVEVCGLSAVILETFLVDVSEPERCRYAMVLSTPLVCHPDSLLVWPALSDQQRQRWSLADTELFELTGHAAELAQILWESGLGVAPPTPAARPAFASLAVQCHTAYEELA
ncbi:hypothetical protein HPB52_021814 [Rhipicephalus sanguineus]|uniref:MRH domain-containing protein n=1 Tax=Rhipicephalus sanguineus TaxID=34632 RepID=A0A9D4PKP0_RHISA|nr:hypothetical protein HPB52_021814 [Rhipicephalus sanguineus]